MKTFFWVSVMLFVVGCAKPKADRSSGSNTSSSRQATDSETPGLVDTFSSLASEENIAQLEETAGELVARVKEFIPSAMTDWINGDVTTQELIGTVTDSITEVDGLIEQVMERMDNGADGEVGERLQSILDGLDVSKDSLNLLQGFLKPQ